MPKLLTIREQINMLGMAEGFFQSNVLFALLKLDVFERIGRSSRSLDELAAVVSVPVNRLRRLLNAGVAIGLLATEDGMRYSLSRSSSAVLLRSAGDAYLGDWIRMLANIQQRVTKLQETDFGYRRASNDSSPNDERREFTLAMHDYAVLRGNELARYLDTSACSTLLDVGCGSGDYAFQLGEANPQLHLHLLDAPDVLAVAHEIQEQYALRNQVTYLPSDVVLEDIPGQYDLVLVSNTLHMLGPSESQKLIRRLHSRINAGGCLVIQAQYLRDDRLGDRWPLMLDLLMLCLTPQGENHSVEETKNWLAAAGFVNIQYRPMSLWNTNSLVLGFRT
jgi:SAM-dependent methyltransferase